MEVRTHLDKVPTIAGTCLHGSFEIHLVSDFQLSCLKCLSVCNFPPVDGATDPSPFDVAFQVPGRL